MLTFREGVVDYAAEVILVTSAAATEQAW